MKILGLDLGDQWIGIAISDALGMFARPLKTVTPKALSATLTQLLREERISAIVVGLPRTMKGTESEQTVKVLAQYEQLKAEFPAVTWALWDERLTSKRAQSLSLEQGKKRTAEQKNMEHAVAAAFILQGYLDYQAVQKQKTEAEN
jgi:putative Holliday junction resolvase